MSDSDKQTKLRLYIMNHHTFLMICMLQYPKKNWCLVIYKYLCIVIQEIIYFNTFVTNSDQLKFFRRKFLFYYKLHNYKFMTIFFLVASNDKYYINMYYIVLHHTIV